MRQFILYLFTSLLIISCDEHLRIDANEDPQGYADSQFVGTWKVTAVESDVSWDYDNNGTSETNIFLTWTNCQKDNLYSFVGDKSGTFKFDCNNTKIGSWEIAQTKYLNYIPAGGTPESEKVVQMTSVQFKTTIALTLSNGQPATITKTWDRQ
jgi:hypothetical protein